MRHVDEGALHALLDGELAPAEAAEVRVHFATCPSCAARLDEARQLLAETERLVSALELPRDAAQPEVRAAGSPRPPDPRPGAATASAVADVMFPPSPGTRTPLPPLDPVVLIPENPTIRELRRNRMRLMAWAAGFLVVVGAGFLGVTNLREAPRSKDGRLTISPDEFTSAPARSQREGATVDTAPTLGLTDAEVPSLTPAKLPAPAPEAEAEPPAPQRQPPPAPEPKAVAPEPKAAAPARPAPSAQAAAAPAAPRPPQERADADRAMNDEPQAKAPESARDSAPPVVSRGEQPVSRTAAQATSELDRRRTRERAAAATAALDREMSQRRAAEERERQLAAERAAAASAAAPPPARPSADERTGISSRIGLDEAARQLGGPLHAIDGMTRQSVGLVPGASVEGADPGRPVVRAVYLDRTSGTMLFLDQQMAQPGDGPVTPQTGRGGRQVWVKDGVLLVLHGDLGADSLRSLARRVR